MALDRRLLLVASLVLYGLAHAVSALASNFELVMAARVALAVSAAIFTPQAAATVGALLPPERRSSAITFVFVGWSLATVGGMPLGGYVAHAFGWPLAFAIVAVMSVLAAVAVYLTVPRGVRIAPLSLASWKRVLTSNALMTVLLVTILNGTGQFTLFTYLSPSLKSSLSANAALITLILAWYGVAATLGNVIASRAVTRIGPARSALVALLGMASGLALWGLGAHMLWPVLAAATLWGLGTFATNSIQQARLAGIAPDLTSASIALNTSAIYFGQAAGSGLGGALINAGAMPWLPWAGAAILLIAAAVSAFAMRYEAP
jgi:MFS transporter, DHA1 family, inner membrane transport protein